MNIDDITDRFEYVRTLDPYVLRSPSLPENEARQILRSGYLDALLSVDPPLETVITSHERVAALEVQGYIRTIREKTDRAPRKAMNSAASISANHSQ